MVKKGYKQTEIGVIPEDWEINTLEKLCSYINDGTHYTPNYVVKGIPFYSVENIPNDNFSDTKYISEDEHQLLIKRCFPERGDILMTRIGTLGKTKLIDWEVNASIYVSLALLKINNSIDESYLFNYTKSDFFLNDVKKRSLLNATPQKINMGEIVNIPIYFPPTLIEQKAIATALTDIDHLITNLETLITKKKAIKQGAMQQLLTGKKRLQGFTGDWETKTLGEVANMSSGGTPLTSIKQYYNGSIPWMVIADITKAGKYISTTEKRITSLGVENSNTVIYPKETLFFAMYASIGKCTISKVEMTCNQAILGITPHSINTAYLFYYLFSIENKLKNAGQTGTQSNLNKEMVMDLNIPYPKIKEQQAIAQILSDMDSEIESLEQQKCKTQHLKQGMMQELLTGKTRLVIPVSKTTQEENKIVSIAAEPQSNYETENSRNEHFNDAVLIGTMAKAFGSEKYPLTRFMYTKVSYLFKRYKEEQDQGYLKKVAGPYKPKTRYGGAEKIALGSKYVKPHISTYKGKKHEHFLAGEKYQVAVDYFVKWYGEDALQWIQQFKYTKRNQLELWATVDMAMEDLKQENKPINLQSVKNVIKNNKEWKEKLKKDFFSDANITKTIKGIPNLFR